MSKRRPMGNVPGMSSFASRPVSTAALLALCLAAPVLAPAPARGARTLYASYDGYVGAECSEAEPCTASRAVDLASDGDTVELLYSPGHDYELSSTSLGLRIDDAITLRGQPGQPWPTLHVPSSGFWGAAIQVLVPGVVVERVRVEATERSALELSTTGNHSNEAEPIDGSVVRDVELEATNPGSGPAVYIDGESTLERATVKRLGTTTHDALWLEEGPLVRDSIVLRNAEAVGEGIRTFGSEDREIRLRNMTIGATGDGIFALAGPYEVSVRNSLIDGQINDILAWGDSTHVVVSYSNFNPTQITDHPPEGEIELVAPNQDQRTEVFELVNPAGLDFHQLASSPTVDAGSVDAFTGSLDIDGEPRLMGAGIDIGADELPDTEPPETAIGSGPAEGSVVKTAAPSFEFSSLAADLAGFECSLDEAPFAACTSPYATTALADGAHSFRVRAIDTGGHVDPTPATRAFTVDASTQSGSSSPISPVASRPGPNAGSPSSPDGGVTIVIKGKRLKLHGRRALIRLACPAAEVSPPCAGTLALRTAAKLDLGRRHRRLTLARARFSIDAGKTKKTVLRFTKRAARLLRMDRVARRARAVVRVHDGAGNQGVAAKAQRLIIVGSHGRR